MLFIIQYINSRQSKFKVIIHVCMTYVVYTIYDITHVCMFIINKTFIFIAPTEQAADQPQLEDVDDAQPVE